MAECHFFHSLIYKFYVIIVLNCVHLISFSLYKTGKGKKCCVFAVINIYRREKLNKKEDMLMTRKTAAWLIACAALIIGLAVIMIAALAKDRKPSADTARFVIQNEFRAPGKDLTP